MNLQKPLYRAEPIRVRRPGTPEAPAATANGGANGGMAEGLHHNPDGSMVAVGFQGMLQMAAAAGAVHTVPSDGDSQ